MSESVLVIGAGIAGLCTALALGPTCRQVILVERDAAPPEGDADTAFREWKRTGVGHLRQSHAFLARLSLLPLDLEPATRLGDIARPTLLLCGREDKLISVAMPRFKAAPPKSKLIIFEQCGHLPMEELAARSAGDVLAFIAAPP